MAQLYNIKAVYPMVGNLYGIEIDIDSFEDIALAGWELIGNKHTRLYRYNGSVIDGEMKLPCNVEDIESVRVPGVDFERTSNKEDYINTESAFVEHYIEAWNHKHHPLHDRGKLVNYREGDNTLYFEKDYPVVSVLYHGIIVDDESGLPLVNEKEMKALAAFVAWREMLKEGFKKKDVNMIRLAKEVESEWLRRCNAARIKNHLSQNDMNDILDAKYCWDRKLYGVGINILK